MKYLRSIVVVLSVCIVIIILTIAQRRLPAVAVQRFHPIPEKQLEQQSVGWENRTLFHDLIVDNITSQSNNIDNKGKWQQVQVRKFCSKYHLQTDDNLLRDRHFLFNDDKKFILCIVPKVGCTYAKEFMFILAGIIPSSAATKEFTKVQNNFNAGIRKSSFQTHLLSKEEKLQKLNTYWKFTILRNPLERLVSAYRNKLLAPVPKHSSGQFNRIKLQILKKYHNTKLEAWRSQKNSSDIAVDFPTYIRWIVDSPNLRLDQHFKPTMYVTHACRVHYDYYGNFKHMSSDMHQVMDKFNIPREFYRDQSYYKPGSDTSSLLTEYYSALSADLKQALFEDFYTELDFYYHLFPEEKDSHVKLLGVEKEII